MRRVLPDPWEGPALATWAVGHTHKGVCHFRPPTFGGMLAEFGAGGVGNRGSGLIAALLEVLFPKVLRLARVFLCLHTSVRNGPGTLDSVGCPGIPSAGCSRCVSRGAAGLAELIVGCQGHRAGDRRPGA